MPYKIDICGIYKIVNLATGKCYVGQSQRVKKRLREHFRLLRLRKHPNVKLQNAYNKYGRENFHGSIEVECEDASQLDVLEESFLKGDAWFEGPAVYNISDFATAPMRGRAHSDEVRERISLGRRASTFDYRSPEYRKTLSEAQRARLFADPKFVDKVRYILDHPELSYAERARRTGTDTSSARKLALRYAHLKGTL